MAVRVLAVHDVGGRGMGTQGACGLKGLRAKAGKRVAGRLVLLGCLKLGFAAGGLVACAKQQANDDEAGEKRRAALAHERQGDARERHELGDAGHDEEGLEADGTGQAHGGKGRGIRLCAGRGHKAAHAKQQVHDENGRGTQEAHFFSDGREDKVRLDNRDLGGHALANTGAYQAAVCQRVERLDDLVAAALRVGPGVEPDVHAGLDVAKEVVAKDAAHSQQEERKHDVAHAAGADIDHDDKEREEEQGAAQVALEDHQQQADAPHDKQRQAHAKTRDLKRAKAAHRDRERLAVGGQVEGQEQDDQDLGELARLKTKAANRDPQLRAALLGTNKHGEKKQDDAQETQGVLVVGKAVQVLDKEQDRNHCANRDKQPHYLAHSQIRGQSS